MKKRLARFLCYPLLMILSPLLLNAALVTWTGGGAPNDWNDPLNWDIGVPMATDDVVITGSSQIVTLSIPYTVESVEIQSGATLIIASTGVLNLGNDDGVDTNGALDLSSGSGNITNNGTISIINAAEDGIDSRGTFINNGIITITTYTDDGITASKTTSKFTNNGSITIKDPTSAGEVGIVVREGAVFTNSAMKTIDLDMIEEEGIWVQEAGNATVNNAGIINIANIGSGDHGIEVRSTFNNLATGIIKITNLIAGSGDAVRVEDHMPGVFNNAGTLIIDIDPGNTSDAIENQGTFTSTGIIETGCNNNTNELEINGNPNPIDFSGACVNFDIAGTSTGSDEFDQIQPKGGDYIISGATAKLDWGTYVPNVGDCFKIIDGSSTVIGTFAMITSSNATIQTSIDYTGDSNQEVEICVIAISSCAAPTNINVADNNPTAGLSWDPIPSVNGYNWIVVAAGAGPGSTAIASGNTTGTTATASGLTSCTSYDLHVQTDCGGSLSPFSSAHNFTIGLPCTPTTSFPCNGTGLGADVTLNTYNLITSILGPQGNPIEVPDCGHTSFGDHITQAYDPVLMKDVFQFHIHVNEDDDRCINFDRQRNEIKTYNNSPANLLGVLGETVQYTWKFKLDAGFQASSKFTHIHQLKSVGATNNEDSMPQITFTLRKGSPDQFELRYAEDLSQITWAQTDLTPFKGQWVEVTETVTYGDWGQGIYSVDIVQISSGTSLLSYTNNNTRMWKTNASFIRPKWGIYRSLEDAQDLRDEIVCYADFCIDETNLAVACNNPITYLNAANISSSTVDLSWGGVAGATNYSWILVQAGGGPGGVVVASGTTPNTIVTVNGLTDMTSYDLYVTADCGSTNATGFNFSTTAITNEVCTNPIGTGTSSSSSRGPIHQASTSASTRYSRFLQIYTQAELAAVGLTANSSIAELQWFITTSDVISAGSAPLKIYLKNSSAAQAVQDTWTALTTGSTLSLNTTMDLSNNFPGSSGWMPFTLDTPFIYTGGALEVAVEFNWASAVFTNNGSVKWRYSNLPDDLVVRALGTSGYSTNLTYSTTSKQRANLQICYEPPVVTCPAPSNLNVTNLTISSADLSWDPVSGAGAYNWIIVPAGVGPSGAPIASGTTANLTASISDLTCLTAYDLYVQTDCGAGDLSLFSPAFSFVTLPGVAATVSTIGTGTSSSSSRGPIQQGGGTSTTRYSRFNQVFTQAELATAGVVANCLITELQWYLATTDIIANTGDAPFKVYIKNASTTQANVEPWSTIIAGLSPVVDRVFNTTNNFPGIEGWMPFAFNAPFLYTGGALEIAVEWDYGSVSIPAFTGSDASNPNGKSIKWRYSNFTNNVVVRRLGSGSHGTSNLSYATGSTLPSQRANIQILHVPQSDISFTVNMSSTPSDCGFSNGTASASPSGLGSFSYVWSNGATSSAINGITSGSYTVTVTQSPSGCPVVETVTVGVEDDIFWANGFPASIHETCAGENDGAIGALATGGTAPYTYNWEDSSGNTLSSISGLNPGTYFVTATDANGCSIASTAIINPAVALNWASAPSAINTTCTGINDGSVSALVGGGTPPYTYDWVDSNGYSIYSNNNLGNGSNTSTSILAAGMYCVTATDANGCTISGCATVLDNPSLSWSIAPIATDESCFGNNDGTVSATAVGGIAPISYMWTDAAGNAVGTSGLSGGSYTVVATDANGCTVSGTAMVLPGEIEYTMANGNMLSGVQAVTADFEVNGAIESDQLINGGVAVNVDYDSGMCITLKAGFEVSNATVFHAFIDGCGNMMLREDEKKTVSQK